MTEPTGRRSATRTLKWEQQQTLSVSDLRSLLEWLDHLGVNENQKLFIRADDTQKEGYWFYCTVVIEEPTS